MNELKQMMLKIQKEQNKESESYLNVSFMPTDHLKGTGLQSASFVLRNATNGEKYLYAINLSLLPSRNYPGCGWSRVCWIFTDCRKMIEGRGGTVKVCLH